MGATIDLLDPAAVEDPHRYLAPIRDRSPIAWSDRHSAWLITGHPELSEAFPDQRLSTEHISGLRKRMTREREAALSAALELLGGWMVFHEPPAHTRLRSPFSRSFTPRATAQLAPRIEAITTRLLDELEQAGGGDFVQMFSHRLPAQVIAELFGVPPERVGWLASWSQDFAAVVFGATGRPDYLDLGREAGESFHSQMGDVIDRYRREPGNNILSHLLESEGSDSGLSTTEIVAACSLLLFAGHETTSSLLGSGLLALVDHPRELERLRDGSLPTERAVEELLRFEPPAKAVVRTVVTAHERASHRLEEGDQVFMTIIAANRDPRVFDRPDDLRLDRNPNPHIAFGFGHHFCLGAALARLEARIAFPALIGRFPQIAVDGPVTWRPSVLDRSPEKFDVTLS